MKYAKKLVVVTLIIVGTILFYQCIQINSSETLFVISQPNGVSMARYKFGVIKQSKNASNVMQCGLDYRENGTIKFIGTFSLSNTIIIDNKYNMTLMGGKYIDLDFPVFTIGGNVSSLSLSYMVFESIEGPVFHISGERRNG